MQVMLYMYVYFNSSDMSHGASSPVLVCCTRYGLLDRVDLLDNLDIELKLIALSETWVKPYHIDYNMTHYSLEQDYRPEKEEVLYVYIYT